MHRSSAGVTDGSRKYVAKMLVAESAAAAKIGYW